MSRTLFHIFFLSLFFVSCSTTHKSAQTVPVKFTGKNNSYYYYLLSELKKTPETLEQSEEMLQKALELDKNSSVLWAEKALVEARKARWPEALKDAEKSLVQDPQSVDSLILLGKLHAAHNEPALAITFYKRALALDDTNEEAYTVMAREQVTLKDQNAAIQSLHQCLRVVPESMSCLYYLASLDLQAKKYSEALKAFETIRQLQPNNPQVLQTISEIYVQQKDYAKALDVLLELKQLVPGDVTSGIRLGIVYYELKEIDHAIEEFEAISNIYPKSDRIHYYLGMLYEQKENADLAIKHYDAIEATSEFFKESIDRLLILSKGLKGSKVTLDLLNKKVPDKDKTAEQFGFQASLLMNLGEYEESLKVVNDGLARFPDNRRFIFQKAVALERCNRFDEAKSILLSLVTQSVLLDRVYNYLGYSMLEHGENVDEALGYLIKASALMPKDGRVTDSLAWGYYKKGDYQRALVYLNTANKQAPNEFEILEHLGDVYRALKNEWQAKHYYEEALKVLDAVSFKTDYEIQGRKKIAQKLKET